MAKSKSKDSPSNAYAIALADLLATALWVLASSVFGEAAAVLSDLSGVDELYLIIAIVIAALVAFGPVCTALGSLVAKGQGGALFNPVHNLACLGAGKGGVGVHIIRAVGQLIGAVLGSYVAIQLVPSHLQGNFHKLSGGVKDGVAFELGLACEGLLSFALNTVFLMSLEAKSPFLTTWGPLSLNVLLIVVGYQFTGPSLNPFISFGWYVFYKQGSAAEHLLVFWAAPFGGALLAGLMVRVLEARKKARRSRKSPAGIIAAAAKKNK